MVSPPQRRRSPGSPTIGTAARGLRRLARSLTPDRVFAELHPDPDRHWVREVMKRDTERVFASLEPSRLDVVEVSGFLWDRLPWRSFQRVAYPEFDLCAPPEAMPGPFDLVICEQVLEHVLDPLAAVRTLRRLCRDDGAVFVSTPFLIRLHDFPGDYWRFTPSGLDVLLRSQGLAPLWVRSWGNRRCVTANFDRWPAMRRWRSLTNEPHLPQVVWTLAKPTPTAAGTASSRSR